MEHFLLAASLKLSPLRLGGPKSGGLLEPAVATAKATAALAELDLKYILIVSFVKICTYKRGFAMQYSREISSQKRLRMSSQDAKEYFNIPNPILF